MNKLIAKDITGIFTHDKQISRFEGQYPVPDGVTYNTWVIEDDKTVLLDTVDESCRSAWMQELAAVLGGRRPDYLVISHMEPDHSGTIAALAEAYPEITLVGNAKTFGMLDQFFPGRPGANRLTVKDGDCLETGHHALRFVFAPMVHWPEVMTAFDEATGTLFAADAFGTFGEAEPKDAWADEARRYYANIVGKYGPQVKALLAKTAALQIGRVCPLHGPVLEGEGLKDALALYTKWSAWEAESDGTLVACACFHGHTLKAAQAVADELRAAGHEAEVVDLAHVHESYALGLAFKYSRIVLCATTYDGGYAPAMEEFIGSMKRKNLQNRTFALVENGSWAPMAAKQMALALEGMKNCAVLPEKVTLRSAMNEQNGEEIRRLCAALY